MGCVAAAAFIVYNSKLFSVRRIEVGGNKALTQTEVIKASGLKLGENIFKVDLEAAKRRLVKSPWLRSAAISKQLPAIVRVQVRERVPVATVSRPQASFVIDNTAFVLDKRGPLADTGLPIIRDVDVGGTKIQIGTRIKSAVLADALKALLSLSPNLRGQVDTVSAPAADKLVFFTKEGLEIDYGSAADMEAKNAVINRVLKEESGKVVTIDVRVVTNPTSRPKVQKLGGAPAD